MLWTNVASALGGLSAWPKFSDEYQHDRVYIVFKILCALVLLKKVASAWNGEEEELIRILLAVISLYTTMMN